MIIIGRGNFLRRLNSAKIGKDLGPIWKLLIHLKKEYISINKVGGEAWWCRSLGEKKDFEKVSLGVLSQTAHNWGFYTPRVNSILYQKHIPNGIDVCKFGALKYQFPLLWPILIKRLTNYNLVLPVPYLNRMLVLFRR